MRRAKTPSVSRRNGFAARTSDFYARVASKPRMQVPMINRGSRVRRRLSTSTQTQMQRNLMPKSKVRTQVRTRPETEKAIKVVNIMRRRFRAPMGRRKPTTSMEYTRTPAEGNSISYFTRKALRLRGMKKRIMKQSPIRLRKTEIVTTVNWAYGRQGVVTLLHNTNTELDAITDTVTTNPTAKMLIQSTKLHYMITSATTAAVKLRIYEGCYKSDAEAGFTPQTLWANGMVDTGSSEVIGNIDSKPWASPSFNTVCHITKVTNVFLPQGRTHEHYATYNYNKLYNKEMFNISTDRDYLRKWTRFIMFVAYGEPVADTDTDISTASGRLLIVGTKVQRYRYNLPETYVASFTQSIPVVGMGSERIIDEGSGAIETVATL